MVLVVMFASIAAMCLVMYYNMDTGDDYKVGMWFAFFLCLVSSVFIYVGERHKTDVCKGEQDESVLQER